MSMNTLLTAIETKAETLASTTNSAKDLVYLGKMVEALTPAVSLGEYAALSGATFTGNVTVNADLTINGSFTTVNTTNLAVTNSMVYLNEAATANITNASGDGSSVTYTTEPNTFQVGQIVTVTGAAPSSFNLSEATITAVTSTSFTVASTNIDVYSNGGSAAVKTSVNPDLGWSGGYNDGTYGHAGVFRDATDNKFKFYTGYTPEPSLEIDTSHGSYNVATVYADFEGTYSNLHPKVSTIISDISFASPVNTITLGGNTTFSTSSLSQGRTCLLILNTASFTPTFPAVIKWPENTEPDWASATVWVISLLCLDGTNIAGSAQSYVI